MRKAEIRPYGRNNCQIAERIFNKFNAEEFDEKFVPQFKFFYRLTQITVILH